MCAKYKYSKKIGSALVFKKWMFFLLTCSPLWSGHAVACAVQQMEQEYFQTLESSPDLCHGLPGLLRYKRESQERMHSPQVAIHLITTMVKV